MRSRPRRACRVTRGRCGVGGVVLGAVVRESRSPAVLRSWIRSPAHANLDARPNESVGTSFLPMSVLSMLTVRQVRRRGSGAVKGLFEPVVGVGLVVEREYFVVADRSVQAGRFV